MTITDKKISSEQLRLENKVESVCNYINDNTSKLHKYDSLRFITLAICLASSLLPLVVASVLSLIEGGIPLFSVILPTVLPCTFLLLPALIICPIITARFKCLKRKIESAYDLLIEYDDKLDEAKKNKTQNNEPINECVLLPAIVYVVI